MMTGSRISLGRPSRRRARELGGFARRLDRISTRSLTAEEQLERRMLADQIRGRLFELEEVRPWERDPQHYAELLATSLAGQTLFEYAPLEERARRIVSKLRQTPRLIEAAETNIQDPPGIFIKLGAEAFDGVGTFIEGDLPRAFRQLEDPHLLGDLADACDRGDRCHPPLHQPSTRYAGAAKSCQLQTRARAVRGTAAPPGRNLAWCRAAAGHRGTRARHDAGAVPRGGPTGGREGGARRGLGAGKGPVTRRRASSSRRCATSSATFSRSSSGTTSSPCQVASRWSSRRPQTFIAGPSPASGHPDLSSRSRSQSYYYVTDVDPSWSAERAEEHLRDLNLATLWSVSVHEAYPGHFLHFRHQQRIERTLRKSTLFAPVSFIEGWAHYCEQMVMDAGLGRDDVTLELGQIAEALVRLVRMVVGIKLHTEDMSDRAGGAPLPRAGLPRGR